ncbi:MAG: L-seryl-tRNA(Sec) selenium transferase [Candidatus Marinimicrobia bacterium]|nr:L-seryl-tRNA(Sec) selenium transferase [Candidatus Neomarinimicrobiota bacterium]
MDENLYQEIPSIDKLYQDFSGTRLMSEVLLSILREEVGFIRQKILNHEIATSKVGRQLHENIHNRINTEKFGHIKKVVNGTGILLHTGLGRAPFSIDFFDDLKEKASGYFNLEFDLNTGKRGERLDLVRKSLRLLSTAENSVVVNNNAAALILILNTLASGKEVLVSRGELIEIGGSFRLPDVIEKSGAVIKEIGTTNRTHLKDYEKAISANTGAILVVHTSNYKIEGFTKTPESGDIIQLGHKHRIPVILDQGSGDFDTGETYIVPFIKKGFDLVCFSGDKLLGGPQSGIILGKNEWIEKVHSNPFYRAFRCDKFTLLALDWTLRKLINGQSNEIYKNRLLIRSLKELESLASEILKNLKPEIIEYYGVEVTKTSVEAGSGSLPGKKIDSMALVFKKTDAEKLRTSFRTCNVPVIGYISNGCFYIDFKAIAESEAKVLKEQMTQVLV